VRGLICPELMIDCVGWLWYYCWDLVTNRKRAEKIIYNKCCNISLKKIKINNKKD